MPLRVEVSSERLVCQIYPESRGLYLLPPCALVCFSWSLSTARMRLALTDIQTQNRQVDDLRIENICLHSISVSNDNRSTYRNLIADNCRAVKPTPAQLLQTCISPSWTSSSSSSCGHMRRKGRCGGRRSRTLVKLRHEQRHCGGTTYSSMNACVEQMPQHNPPQHLLTQRCLLLLLC